MEWSEAASLQTLRGLRSFRGQARVACIRASATMSLFAPSLTDAQNGLAQPLKLLPQGLSGVSIAIMNHDILKAVF
jgi:hypothetical protein